MTTYNYAAISAWWDRYLPRSGLVQYFFIRAETVFRAAADIVRVRLTTARTRSVDRLAARR